MFCYFLLLWFIVVVLLCQDMIYIVLMALTNNVYIIGKVRTCSYHNKQDNYQTLECQLLFHPFPYCHNLADHVFFFLSNKIISLSRSHSQWFLGFLAKKGAEPKDATLDISHLTPEL